MDEIIIYSTTVFVKKCVQSLTVYDRKLFISFWQVNIKKLHITCHVLSVMNNYRGAITPQGLGI